MAEMKKVIYPGSFDPPTLGHLNIVQRATGMFDHVVVAMGNNLSKTPSFSLEERVELFKIVTKNIKNVVVMPFEGLLVDFAKEQNADFILRGIRNIFEFEKENLQAQVNRQLSGLETLYLTVDEKYRLISSTLVKEIAFYGKRLAGFVPDEIEEMVFERLGNIIKK